jgi:hypothetical protein
MMHARLGTGREATTSHVDFHCVSCGVFVARETIGFLAWLVQNQEAVYCEGCDPLPEAVPEVLVNAKLARYLQGTTKDIPCLLDHKSAIPV